LFLVEDNGKRVERIREWLPESVTLVHAASAGQAIGILERDRGRTYGAVMLDHDLGLQARTQTDLSISGKQVTQKIIEALHPDTYILVHSMNPSGGEAMTRALGGAGFYVRRRQFWEIEEAWFKEWLAESEEAWRMGLED